MHSKTGTCIILLKNFMLDHMCFFGRQYGSGGREVGQKLAAHYGINCYDNELITKVAKESGFCPEIVQQQDERPTNSFLYNLVMDTYSFGFSGSGFSDMPISQKVFLAQYDMSSTSFSTRVRSSGSPELLIIPTYLRRIRPIPTNSGSTFFAKTNRDRVITIIIP